MGLADFMRPPEEKSSICFSYGKYDQKIPVLGLAVIIELPGLALSCLIGVSRCSGFISGSIGAPLPKTVGSSKVD